jgi:hypothetical protein
MLAVMSAIPFAGLSGGPIRGTRLNALDALSARAVRIAALPGLQRAQCAPEQTPGRRPPQRLGTGSGSTTVVVAGQTIRTAADMLSGSTSSIFRWSWLIGAEAKGVMG